MEFFHRHPIMVLIVAGTLAVVGVGVLVGFAGVGNVVHAVRTVDLSWLGYAAALQAVSYLGYTVAYQATGRLHGGARLSPWTALKLVAAGFGAFAVGGGFAIDHRALVAVEKTRRMATVRVLGLGVLEYAVLAPAAAIAAAVLVLVGPHERYYLTIPWLIGVPVGFAAAVWISRPVHQEWLRRRHGRVREWLADILAGIAVLRRLAQHPVAYAGAFLGCAVYWAGDIGCLYACLRAFGHAMDVQELIVAYATGYALTRRSLPLAGAGVTELLLPYALYLFGLSLAPAIVAVAAYRLFNFGLPMLPALAARPTVERMRHGAPPRVGRLGAWLRRRTASAATP